MSNPANKSMPCGEPARHSRGPSVHVQKFNKLSEELSGERSNPMSMEPNPTPQDYHGGYFKPVVGGPTTSTAGTFLVAHASTSNNTSCIIDPLRMLNKSPLDTLLARPNKEKAKESSVYLADTLKYFDKQVWLNRGVTVATSDEASGAAPQPQLVSEAAGAPSSPELSTLSKRNVSSPFVSVNEDYDEDYHQVSDVESEGDTDADAYAEIGHHYVLEAKSKDSFLDIIYEDALSKEPKKPKHSGSDVSNDSALLESGYKSNHSCPTTPRFPSVHKQPSSEEIVTPIARRMELVSSTPARGGSASMVCRSFMSSASGGSVADTVATSSAPDTSEQISNLIVDLIGPHSRVGKLIFQSCANSQDRECILEEIKQCVQADLQVEDKLTSFFRNQHAPATATQMPAPPNAGTIVKYDTLRNLDDTLAFIKENISQIRDDFNEFREHSFKKIDSKVNYTEFSDATAVLHAKMTHLERKIFNDQRIMRQDIRICRDKISYLENEASCGLKNFPVWPFIAFIGAYSIINLGRR